MKCKFCTVLITVVGLTASAGVFGLADSDGIVGSTHDFSDEGWNTTGEICVVCHAPHGNTLKTWEIGLLWNHQLSAQTYLMYAEAQDAFPFFISFIDGAFQGEPTGPSKLCLSCHDGTIAVDAFGETAGGTHPISDAFRIPGFTTDSTLGTQDMRGTHPISVTYDNTADTGDPGLHDPSTATFPITGTLVETVLWNGEIHCSSCHDVHDSVGETVVGTRLLRGPMDDPPSGLCLTCHNK
jgi:hypothetical protein